MFTDLTPRDRRLMGTGFRVELIALAAFAAAFDAAPWISTPLAALAAVITAESMLRRRRLGWTDALLVGISGVLIALVLLGLVLQVFPFGLTRVSWSVGAGVLAAATVAYGYWADLRDRPDTDARPRLTRPAVARLLRGAPWYLATAAVIAVALGLSVHATDLANRAPAQLAVVAREGTSVSVQVSGGLARSRYQVAITHGSSTNALTPITLDEGETFTYRLQLDSGRTSVVLRHPGHRAMQSLILRSGGRA